MSILDVNKKQSMFLVGRFQTPELTSGQIDVLKRFLEMKTDVHGIILGVPAAKASKNNPLDFDSRRRMIEDAFPKKFLFGYVKDENNDFDWSRSLESAIRQVLYSNNILRKNDYFSPKTVTIIGDKTNTIGKYFGNYNTQILELNKIDSMEFQKEFVSKKVTDPSSWRAGACWSATNRYPVAYHTVDCAIFDDMSFNTVWMAKKFNEDKLRFVGGFVDPNDESAEKAALREALEETKMHCTILGYISSRKIDDWRYRNEEDKIITTLYGLIRQNGDPVASDDIMELYKVNILTLNEKNVMSEHHKLLQDVQGWVRTKQIFAAHGLPEITMDIEK